MRRLSGRVVAITRDGSPDDPLARKLEDEGARVLSWPTLSFEAPGDDEPLRRAIAALTRGDYDWVVFTSARSVEPLGAPPVDLTARTAAVGEATAAELRRRGWRVDVVGDRDAGALVEALSRAAELRDTRVLFPAASLAGDALEDGLSALGARVDRVEAYRTVPTPPDGPRVRADLEAGVDAAAFASPSAVHALVAVLEPHWPEVMHGVGFAAIGPSTAGALEASGIPDHRIATADPPSLDGLVEACVESIQLTRTRTP